jgi:hypothetical protein
MNSLILDKETLKMLTTAHEITANQSGDRHYLTIYPKAGNYEHKTELPLEGSIRGSSIDKDNIYSTTSSASLCYSELDVFKFLKVGDEIKLVWYPDTGIPFLDNLNLVGQKLDLMVWRKNGKQMDLLRLHLANSVHSKTDTYSKMCQGFRSKVSELA